VHLKGALPPRITAKRLQLTNRNQSNNQSLIRQIKRVPNPNPWSVSIFDFMKSNDPVNENKNKKVKSV